MIVQVFLLPSPSPPGSTEEEECIGQSCDNILFLCPCAVFATACPEGMFLLAACLAGNPDIDPVNLTPPHSALHGLSRTWDPALVGLVPGVGPDVLLEVGELGELPLADLAAVGLYAQVDPGVLGQVGTVGEGLATAGALVGLRLA